MAVFNGFGSSLITSLFILYTILHIIHGRGLTGFDAYTVQQPLRREAGFPFELSARRSARLFSLFTTTVLSIAVV